MTDKPPGKLQSDLENERERAEHVTAPFGSVLSFLAEEGKEEGGRKKMGGWKRWRRKGGGGRERERERGVAASVVAS